MVFGCSTVPTDSVKAVMDANRGPVFAPPHRAYQSEVAEPLGKPRSFGHKLPDHMMVPSHRFGVKSVPSEGSKELLFPSSDPPVGSPKREAMYQLDRGYGWEKAGIELTTHRFGRPSAVETISQLRPTTIVDIRSAAGGAAQLQAGHNHPSPSPPKSTRKSAATSSMSVADALVDHAEPLNNRRQVRH